MARAASAAAAAPAQPAPVRRNRTIAGSMQSAATAPATLVTRPHCTNSVYPPSYQPPGSEMCSTKAVRPTAGDQPSSRAKAANAAPGARKSPMIARVWAPSAGSVPKDKAADRDLQPGLAKWIELDRVTTLVLTDPAQHVTGCQLSPEDLRSRHMKGVVDTGKGIGETSGPARGDRPPPKARRPPCGRRRTGPPAQTPPPRSSASSTICRDFDRRSHLRRVVSR